MEKIVWLLDKDRNDLLHEQRAINQEGSMQAICMLSSDVLKKNIEELECSETAAMRRPSLILMDMEVATKDKTALDLISHSPVIAGVPLVMMDSCRTPEKDELAYSLGAMVVVSKPFTKTGLVRIERVALQFDNTRNYEEMMQKQIQEVQNARAIKKLNEQLKSRNDFLHQIFGKYFSDEVLEILMEDPKASAIGGKREYLTVLCSDIRGFSALAEEVDPDALTELLNFYFGKMTEAITKYRGTVIEFMGDGVLAVFGAPLKQEHHIEAAIAAAVMMQNSMKEVNAYCKANGLPNLWMGIGIHAGDTFVGNVGSEKMMRYNVLGSTVNQCARIESCCVGGQIMTSQKTLDSTKDKVMVASTHVVALKGFKEPVQICEIEGIEGIYTQIREREETDQKERLKQGIQVTLHRIVDKKIQDVVIAGEITALGELEAELIIPEGEVLSAFDDIFIDGNDSFKEAYAKVKQVKKSTAVVHFTHKG